MRTFHLLVANTLVASVTNNFLWFALTFWVYLETRSVLATAIIGGGYMLLVAVSGMFFGTFVDRHLRRTSMLLSSAISLVAFALAGLVYAVAPGPALRDLGHPAFWALIVLVLGGRDRRQPARGRALDDRDPPGARRTVATGRTGWSARRTAWRSRSRRCSAASPSACSGWAGAWPSPSSSPRSWRAHLLTIHIDGGGAQAERGRPADRSTSAGRSARSGLVPGLFALLLFSTFNNFLGGVFMSLMDPYGLTLMSVEAWGVLIAFTSLGFIVGGIVVARRGLGANPVRTLLLANVVMWIVTIVFPIRSEILPLAIGFFIYLVLAPVAEASEQTIIQKVVPFKEQGRVFGFAQSLETAASPVTAFLIGPIAQFWVIPSMTDGALADVHRVVVRHRTRPGHGADLHRGRRHRPARDDRSRCAPGRTGGSPSRYAAAPRGRRGGGAQSRRQRPDRPFQPSQRTRIWPATAGNGNEAASNSTAARFAGVRRCQAWTVTSAPARRQVPTTSPSTRTAPGQTRVVQSSPRRSASRAPAARDRLPGGGRTRRRWEEPRGRGRAGLARNVGSSRSGSSRRRSASAPASASSPSASKVAGPRGR